MFRSIVTFLCLAVLVTVPALGQDRQPDIRGVISGQIEAFEADDFALAFGFASPTIRRIFRTPENFGQMVRNGFPMVWRPSDVRFGTQVERGGKTYQPVFLRDQKGVGYVALYEMVKIGNEWQINGVQVLPEAEYGA